MGFRKSWEFNQALLSKLAWWMLSGKSCLCVNVLRAKYKIRNNWLSHISQGNSSPIWKSLGVKYIFSKAACMTVGDGNSIRIWDDPWIPDLQGFIPKPKVGVNLDEILLVSQLLNSDHNAWDIHLLKHWFEDSEIELILKIPLSSCVVEDGWTWAPTSSGDLTVKSAYWFCRGFSAS